MFKFLSAISILIFSIPAFADMEYEAGGYMAAFEGSSYGLQLKVGNDNWPVYGWAGYEGLETRMLGQGVADIEMYTVGIGAEHHWDEFSVFIEGGYAFMDYYGKQNIIDEVVYTHLVTNHNVSETRPVPAADPTRPYGYGDQDPKYHPDNTRSSYDIEDEFIGRIGVGYQISKHLKMTASYRFLTPRERIMISDTEQVARGGGWWQESYARDLSSWEMGFFLTF